MTDLTPWHEMMAQWMGTREALAQIERDEHPDIIDPHGRAWVWRSKNYYSHDRSFVVTDEWIMRTNLPPESLSENWNYHTLCEICTSGWSPEAKARHAQNAVDMADYKRLGWTEYQKMKESQDVP